MQVGRIGERQQPSVAGFQASGSGGHRCGNIGARTPQAAQKPPAKVCLVRKKKGRNGAGDGEGKVA